MATDPNTITPGSLVPMSSILAALEGVLSEAERQALMTQLINVSPQGVAPGDLITAELFNQILGDINALTLRVIQLESGTAEVQRPPVITRIDPTPVMAGQEMIVQGQNLLASRLVRIAIGDSRISPSNLKPGSSDQRMIFDAPSVAGLPAEGAAVTLEVSNDDGTARSAFIMRPGVSDFLAANFEFRLVSVTPTGNLARGQRYDIELEILATSSHAERFTLTPQLAVAPATGWSLTFVGDSFVDVGQTGGTPESHTVRLRLQTGNNNGSGVFTITAASTNFSNFVPKTSLPVPVAVGSPLIEADSAIRFQTPNLLGPATQAIAGNEIRIARADATAGQRMILVLPFVVDVNGTYQVSAGATGAGWQAAVSNSFASFPGFGPGSNETRITITLTSNTPADGQINFTITEAASGDSASSSLALRVVDTP